MRRFRPAAPKPTVARSAVGVPTAAALLLLMALPTGLGAAIFSVTRTDDLPDSAPGDGLCVAAAGGGCSLRAAVQEANALFGTDGIFLPPGTYTLSIPGAGEELAASGDLDVTSPITLLGSGWAVSTIAMASFGDRIFDVHGFAGLEIGDVTLTGGSVAGIGGGVQVRAGGSFGISRSRVQGCFAHHGGAIGTVGGSVTVTDSELSFNYAAANPPTWFARGPAISADEQATVALLRSSVHHNQYLGSGAGAIDVSSSSLAIESSSVVDDGSPATAVNGTDSDLEIVSSTLGSLSVVGLSPPGASLSLGCSIVGLCALTGGNLTYANNGLNVYFAGGGCVGATDVDNDWSLYPLWAPSGKFAARVPDPWSAAREGGHPFVCATDDQWGQTLRPFDDDGDGIAVLEIGAVEGAAVVFFDGFEIGTTDRWSSTIP